ncbi:intraflagellar transport protein 81 homolog [Octopus sinensis]|uniref:Intraflagellar transport protein 81 homolog n=1 Tax=Octopus sinensis TaxID=2607531 RepID=A0A6P7SKR5_9MOLL|nr:intraflagellar transport protein 81 homolog [Octopus sinensis]XP_029639052.1 intraflagellar transport protein 81 homolog [Octopus sinensis]XP_036360751.1 intraflagellar transport protein 81 homolog [Octopus sinensis]
MRDQLKFIVQGLNKEPFNKNFNLISFDSLEPLSLLQILTDVLAEIDSKHKLDIRQETPDQTALRIMNTLKILKYTPPSDKESFSDFNCGLVQAEKSVVYPILEWLLQRITDLKKRAYLAQFLVKITVPTDIMQDQTVIESYEQYEELIEQFKEWHKHSEQQRNSSFNTSEIRRDISQMEEEKEQLLKRIERLKHKVESHPNAQTMMAVARKLRRERDEEKKLAEQKQRQNEQIHQAEQKIRRLQQQLKNTQQYRNGATAKMILQQLEEEIKTNKYVVSTQQVKEIEEKKKIENIMQMAVSERVLGQPELEELENQLQDLITEVNQLIEKKGILSNGGDDKLHLFRNQATIVARKKDEKIEEVKKMREEINKLSQQYESKRQLLKETGGGEILRGEDYMMFVNKLRSKSNLHKKKKFELEEIKVEHGVLSRTEEILSHKLGLSNEQLTHLEANKGVSGYWKTQEELEKVSTLKSEFDEMKDKQLEDMSHMIHVLTGKIGEKKETLAPIIENLRSLREECKNLTQEYEEKKSSYNMQSANLETQRSQLEKEVQAYRDESNVEETRYHLFSQKIAIIKAQKQRVSEEIQAYKSLDAQDKKKTLREIYQRKIKEQENMGKKLREKKKFLQDNYTPNLKQMKVWKDFLRIMECKKQCFEQASLNHSGSKAMNPAWDTALLEEDRLVL